ncbi:MAG: hypothetical protein KUG79_16295 [Pseudomonadales bacterium]|nr:hypothetical protein [Pseudomonadales bacterium]
MLSDFETQIFIDGIGILPGGGFNIPKGSTPADIQQLTAGFNTGSRTSITVTYQVADASGGRAGISLDDLFFDGEQVAPPEPVMIALLPATN